MSQFDIVHRYRGWHDTAPRPGLSSGEAGGVKGARRAVLRDGGYPALHRLDNRGLLATEWRQSETGRDAKYYNLTKKGRAELERERASWRKFTRTINVVLRTADSEG